MRELMRTVALGPGSRAKLSDDCPIDFEGAGPVPGEVCRIVSQRKRTTKDGVTAVKLERSDAIWLIPSRYVEAVG